MSKAVEFKDFNFKLAVINVLMYEKGLIEPKIYAYDFVESYTERVIDLDEEGYDIIPEIKKYFEDLKIDPELLGEVEAIYQDGGDAIYRALCPLWDGEDDVFNINSAEDVSLLPNLKSATLFYHDGDDSIIKDFESKGVAAKWL